MSDAAMAAATTVNVADRLGVTARRQPGRLAVVAARRGGYESIRYQELNDRATNLARGLGTLGVRPGARLALLVRPGVDFVALVFGLLRSGATMVLVDAGLGRKNIVNCLAATEPEGFVGIPAAHVLRCLYRRKFSQAKLNVTVGRRWCWGGATLRQIETAGANSRADLPQVEPDDPAAIVFTSGSTGPPKGVEYRHLTFATQLSEIERMYGLKPGGVDLACFPLFGLFNVALGTTTILPEMDFSRPASCDPAKLIAAAQQWEATQSFASPAVWDRVSRYCQMHAVRLPTLREAFSCGAPVSNEIIERTLAHVHPKARMHTPYGMTECLPVSTIEAADLTGDTAAATAAGRGVCVGRRVESIAWRVIAVTDEPIDELSVAQPVAEGEIGELVVAGPQVSRRYVATGGEAANLAAKIAGGGELWHRTGDVGYIDAAGQFWYCGRKSQRVVLADRTLYTECVEGVFNAHPAVHKSALVGVQVDDETQAAIVVEPESNNWNASSDAELRQLAQQHELTRPVRHMFVHDKLPVDIRHNSKIRREELTHWAQQRVSL